jgi:hypothetical protein
MIVRVRFYLPGVLPFIETYDTRSPTDMAAWALNNSYPQQVINDNQQ